MRGGRQGRRPIFIGIRLRPLSRGLRMKYLLIIAMCIALAGLTVPAAQLKRISGEIALSDASDAVTMAINETVNRKLAEKDCGYDYFVKLERDELGGIAAITTDMTKVNAFASELLGEVTKSSNSGALDIEIPLGNLLGSSLLLGRGPDVPVRIVMLTSPRTEFKNELVSTGINQSKHQIMLEVIVDIDILIPWATLSTQVKTDVLIAETVIIGEVPETYLNWSG